MVGVVLDEVGRGGTTATVAARTGLPADLVAGVVAELAAAGLVRAPSCPDRAAGTCGVAGLPRAERPVTCAGCPLAR